MLTKNKYVFDTKQKLKYLILIVLVRVLHPFYRKENDIWVFGGKAGNEFSDNSRYFYEYILNNHKNIKPVWVTNQNNVIDEVKSIGGESCRIMSLKSLKYVMKAKVYVSSHFIDSDIRIFDDRNTIFVNLWHGMPIKKIVYDSQTNASHSTKFSRFHKKFRSEILNYKDSRDLGDIICSTSEYTKSFMQSAFRSENVYITGQLRGDKIYELTHKNSKKKFIIKSNASQKLLLYMPTHRGWGAVATKDLFEDKDIKEEFLKLLEENNIIFALKLHPNEVMKYSFEESDYVTNISDWNVDVQELLVETDILITDYSSVFIDYALLKKPIIFYPYDLDNYMSKDMGLYIDYNIDLPGPVVYEEHELLNILKRYLKDTDNSIYLSEYRDKLCKFNYFFDEFSGERVFEHIQRMLNQE